MVRRGEGLGFWVEGSGNGGRITVLEVIEGREKGGGGKYC